MTACCFSRSSWTALVIRRSKQPALYIRAVLAGWPETAGQTLDITGHLPRNYPSLSLTPWRASQLLAGSSQGISRVSIPDGRLLDFWELQDQQYHVQPSLWVSPDHKLLVAVADGDGVYAIPLAQ